MLKTIWVACFCLLTLPALCEPAKYEVATITDVKPHQAAANESSEVPKYDVSLKVGDIIYLTLYSDTAGTSTIRYAGGRQLLVHVGKDTITYNEILGRSQEVPILGRKPAENSKQSK